MYHSVLVYLHFFLPYCNYVQRNRLPVYGGQTLQMRTTRGLQSGLFRVFDYCSTNFMLELGDFSAYISIDGKALPEYGTSMEDTFRNRKGK
jgi:hypothetical protein